MGKVVIFDSGKCRGCLSCMVACATINEGIGDLNMSRVRVAPFWYEGFFVPLVCQQCEKPSCVSVCPMNALTKNAETGVVELDKSRCIGCKLCLGVCPFGNITFVDGTAAKCNTCEGDPTCVKVCQWEALTYGEADEIGAGKRAVVAVKVSESHKRADEL
jgi:carbon-monoxide dehydrogenase iron sulfur subunit